MVDTYWASLPKDQIGQEMLDRVRTYDQFWVESGLIFPIQLAMRRYYASLFTGGSMYRSGATGKYRRIEVNQFRSIVDAVYNLITSERPSLTCQAANTDSSTEKATILGDQLLENYYQDASLEDYNRYATFMGLLQGDAFVLQTWDVSRGATEIVDDEGFPRKYGDIKPEVVSTLDVIRDPQKKHYRDCGWKIIRTLVNKWDLARDPRYKSKAKEIIELTPELYTPQYSRYVYFTDYARWSRKATNDNIYVFTLFHDRTDAMPNGRMVVMLSPDLILEDTGTAGLPYERIPLQRFAQKELAGTPFGYSPAWDLLPLQQSLNTQLSIIETNQKVWGVQSIWTPAGDPAQWRKIDEGMVNVSSNAPPQPLSLVETKPEIFKHAQDTEQRMEVLSGVSSVLRGQPDSNLTSGIAIAIVQAQAVQYNSPGARAYTRLTEEVGYDTLSILRFYVKEPRVIEIAGQGNRWMVDSFKGSDLEGISKVRVQAANGLLWSDAGKLSIAQELLAAKVINDVDSFLEVLNTGSLEPIMEAPLRKVINIRMENEALVRGEQVEAIYTDDHIGHIAEHASELDNPERRKDAKVVDTIEAHIRKHIDLLKKIVPGITMQQIMNQVWQRQLEGAAPQVAQLAPAGVPAVEQAQQIPQVSVPPEVSPETASIIRQQQADVQGAPAVPVR